jgi:hypothetical protein
MDERGDTELSELSQAQKERSFIISLRNLKCQTHRSIIGHWRNGKMLVKV